LRATFDATIGTTCYIDGCCGLPQGTSTLKPAVPADTTVICRIGQLS
jgi:hypothetical protein